MPDILEGRSWIEISSDGRQGTHVYLVIVADDGQELRYKIPHVKSVSWSHDSRSSPPSATIELGTVHMSARANIQSRTTTVENLLTEIAASRIASIDSDEDKFIIHARLGELTGESLDKVASALYGIGRHQPQAERPRAPGEPDADRERIVRAFRDDWGGTKK